jgi:hypothetical protein
MQASRLFTRAANQDVVEAPSDSTTPALVIAGIAGPSLAARTHAISPFLC